MSRPVPMTTLPYAGDDKRRPDDFAMSFNASLVCYLRGTVLSSEVQRIVLLVGLAIFGWLLVYTWTQDFGPGGRDPVTSEPPLVDYGEGDPAVEGRNGDGVENGRATERVFDDDVPVDFAAPGESLTDPRPFVDVHRLVRVGTPVHEVLIDPRGGDIVKLSLVKFPKEVGGAETVTLFDQRGDHVYLAQSGLMGVDGIDRAGVRPEYAVVDPGSSDSEGRHGVVLQATEGGVTVTKRITFRDDDYLIDVQHEIDNQTDRPIRVEMFGQLKRDDTRPEKSGVPFGPRPYVGAAFTSPDDRYDKIDFEDLDDSKYKRKVNVEGGWVAVLQHYFVTAWVGDHRQVNGYYGERQSGRTYVVGFVAPEVVVPPNERRTVSAGLYAGPKDQRRLEEIAPHLNLTVDYGFLWWMSVPLFHVLDAIHSVVGNWGVAIILLTFCVKLLLYPLASASYRSMAKMKKVMPQVKRLQERYSDNRQELSQKMMALYKKEGANPLGGCLPLLVQMPVFLALYWVLIESVELRQAPFVLWIKDLAAMDPLFVLPLLYGVSFYVMQLLNPPPPDPMQAKVMKAMPIVFTALFVFFPAGLVLYWLVNNLLSLLQQWYITRKIEKASA